MWPVLVEFRSTSSESRWRKKKTFNKWTTGSPVWPVTGDGGEHQQTLDYFDTANQPYVFSRSEEFDRTVRVKPWSLICLTAARRISQALATLAGYKAKFIVPLVLDVKAQGQDAHYLRRLNWRHNWIIPAVGDYVLLAYTGSSVQFYIQCVEYRGLR